MNLTWHDSRHALNAFMKSSLLADTTVEVTDGKCFDQVCVHCIRLFVVFVLSNYCCEYFGIF